MTTKTVLYVATFIGNVAQVWYTGTVPSLAARPMVPVHPPRDAGCLKCRLPFAVDTNEGRVTSQGERSGH